MGKNNYESLLDAFRDLSSVSDEEVLTPRVKKMVKEGKEFNLNYNGEELKDAREFMKQSEEHDEIEVIDINADTLDHVKEKKAYVGQVILQCNKCHANRFIDLEKLKVSPEEEDVYNTEDECPNCHSEGSGYELVGQVGKVSQEEISQEPTETSIENTDKESDEVKFENDAEEEQPIVEEPQAEETQAEETQEQDITTAADELDFTPEEESDGMETSVSDDDDLELPALGDEFDADTVRPDDTSDDIELEDDKKEEKVKEKLEEEPKPIKRKLRLPTREALQTLRKVRCSLTEEVLHKIVLPESISKVIVNSGKNTIYEGLIEELPEEIINSSIEGFNVANGYLTCNVDITEDNIKLPLAKILNSFDDDDTSKIIIWDCDTNKELFQGSKAAAIRQFGHCQFVSLDAPKVLCLKVKGFDTCVGDECNHKAVSPEEMLCDRIFLANDLAKHNADDPRCEEFWISESIHNKEDLAFVYDRYVKDMSNKLIEEFKQVTGYKTELDEMCDKHDVKPVKADEGLSGNDFNELLLLSNKLGMKTLAELQKFAEEHGNLKDGQLLNALRDAVNDKVKQPNKELSLVTEGVRSFKSRKALSEAIETIKATEQSYKVKRSKKDGYRYDLIIESVKEPLDPDFAMSADEYKEYIEEAKRLAKEIENYSLMTCEEMYYDTYGFDHNKPEDEAEQIIADALINRIKEISTKEPVIFGEALEEDFEVDEIDAEDSEEVYSEETGDDFKDSIGFLANDELEAIAGYKEVIEFFKEKGIDEDKIIDRLKEMQEDEEEHLEELKELYTAITGEEMVELPEEESKEEPEESKEEPEESEEETNDGIENEPELELELEIDPSTIAPTDEALTETKTYTKQELIDAVIDAYGYTQKEALDFIKTASEETKVALVQGFKQQAKNNFYNEAVNIKPFFKDENQEEPEESENTLIDIYAEGAEWEAIKKHLIEEDKVPEILYYKDLPVIVGVNPGMRTLPNGDPGYPDEAIEGTTDWEYKYNITQDDFILFVEKNYDVNNFTLKDLKEIDEHKFESFLKDLYLEEAKEDAWDNYVPEDPDYDRDYFEEVDFDTEAFDADLNEYFKEAYESPIEYKSNSGVVDKKGNIMLEGVIKLEDVESNITFTLTPLNAIVTESLDSTTLQEQINKQEYKVTNNLSEEVFTFDFTRKK